jgi:hypothetical protein
MAKFKLDLEDLSPNIEAGFGLRSNSGALELCYHLNLETPELRFERLREDLYQDYKDIRFFYRLFGFKDSRENLEVKLLENRSYRSEEAGPKQTLFEIAPESEKNWLSFKEGYNFFLWFEGNKENVNFTLSLEEKLRSCSRINLANALDTKYLNKINKLIKYTNGL